MKHEAGIITTSIVAIAIGFVVLFILMDIHSESNKEPKCECYTVNYEDETE